MQGMPHDYPIYLTPQLRAAGIPTYEIRDAGKTQVRLYMLYLSICLFVIMF